MVNNWKHIKTIIDGDEFRIKGLNIWEHNWKRTGNSTIVKDPLYGQEHSMDIYVIVDKEETVMFAAGEFSNCVWGIYMKD